MTTTPYQDGWQDCTKSAIEKIDEIIKLCDPDFLSERCLMQLAGGIANMLRELPVPPEPSPWRPISEAPRDGTVVDLWSAGSRSPECYFHNGRWVQDLDDCERCGESATIVHLAPTHFKLPPPGPEEGE